MGMKIATKFKTGVSSSKIDAILNKSKYKTALEQFLLDTKQIKQTFTEVGRQKVEMGKVMEPIIKDLVEKTFNIELEVDKNRYVHDVHDMYSIEFDALDWKNKVVYEFKNTEKDEKSILETYYPQVQFAMYMIGWKNARICYLRNGWELGYIEVKRDQNFIDNMEIVANYYVQCLKHNERPDLEYIDSISDNIDFYRSDDRLLKGVGVSLELTADEISDLYAWNDIKAQIAKLETQEQLYKEKFADKYGKFSDGVVTYSNMETEREGGINIKELLMDNPKIDIRKYTKEPTRYSRQLLRIKKSRGDELNTGKFTEDLV
jgi:predicted phage-related endonuclease